MATVVVIITDEEDGSARAAFSLTPDPISTPAAERTLAQRLGTELLVRLTETYNTHTEADYIEGADRVPSDAAV